MFHAKNVVGTSTESGFGGVGGSIVTFAFQSYDPLWGSM